MPNIRIYLSSSILARTLVTPAFDGNFTYSQKDSSAGYKKEVANDLVFRKKSDYDAIMLHAADETLDITVEIEVDCGSGYALFWVGSFSLFIADVDEDICQIEVKPLPVDQYKCFQDLLDSEVNLFNGTVVTAKSVTGTYEEVICSESATGAPPFGPIDNCLPSPSSEWYLESTNVFTSTVNNETVYEQRTVWYRELRDAPCAQGVPVPPDNSGQWVLHNDNCASLGSSTWRREPESTANLGNYSNGRTLEQALNNMLAQGGCSLTIKSELLGINASGDHPANIAYTFAKSNLQHLTLHQKSDVKRQDQTLSTSPSWNVNAGDFFKDLLTATNAGYTIADGILRIEHVSWFNTTLGLDLTAETVRNKYNFTGQGNKKKESYYWANSESSFVFRATPIIYDVGEDEVEFRLSTLASDIAYIRNRDSEDEAVSDEGFVLIANTFTQGVYTIINGNEPLKWSNLHSGLFKHGRLYRSGSINGQPQVFESWLPYKRAEPFKTTLPCGSAFDPADLITTRLGLGTISTATLNVKTCRLELELLY